MPPTPPGPEGPREPNPWRQAGLATTIPMMLLAGGLVGFGLGWLIRHFTGWGRWVELVGLALGFIAGVRESILIIRRLR